MARRLFKRNEYVSSLLRRNPPKALLSRAQRLRVQANLLGLSKTAKQRLEWILWYEGKGEKNVTAVARHFGISRKTFHKWFGLFDQENLRTLEEKSRAPLNRRQRTFTSVQYQRVVELRQAHVRYGKMKLLTLYKQAYPDDPQISAWKVQCIIEKSGLYYHPQKQQRINRKRCRSMKRKKITDLKKRKVRGFLVCLDTVVLHWKGTKRYILTAVDRYSKLAFARMYTTHTSSSSRDFLYRLHYLLEGKIHNIQTDNGSEFKLHFDHACESLKIPHYYSRVKTPKDNGVNERFNRTLREEFMVLGHTTSDSTRFNQDLTEWLVEYNFRRPHQSLDYLPPANFHFKYHKVLPMYPSV